MERHPTPPDPSREFVEAVLRTGIGLADLLSDLLDGLPDDAYPGEENAEVLLEMVAGSVRPVLDAAGTANVNQATVLMEALFDRVLADLEKAAQLAKDR